MKHSIVSRIITLTALCGALPAFGCSGADEPLSEEEQAMIDESQAIEEADLAQATQAIGEETCLQAQPDVFSSTLNGGISPTTYGSALCHKGYVVYAGEFTGMSGFLSTVIVAKWADAKPTTKAACESAMTSLYLYRDNVKYKSGSSRGVWDAPGVKGCKTPSVSIEIPITVYVPAPDPNDVRFFDAGNKGRHWRATATARTSAAGPTRKLQIYPYGMDP